MCLETTVMRAVRLNKNNALKVAIKLRGAEGNSTVWLILHYKYSSDWLLIWIKNIDYIKFKHKQIPGIHWTLQTDGIKLSTVRILVFNMLLTYHPQPCTVENHTSRPVFLLTPPFCTSSSSSSSSPSNFLSARSSSVRLRVCIRVSFTLSLFTSLVPSLLHSSRRRAVIVAVGPGWRCSVLSQDLSRPGNMAARRGGGRWLTRHFYP